MFNIPSDTTIVKIEVVGNDSIVQLKLYIEEAISLKFSGVKHIELHYAWNREEYVEGLITEQPDIELTNFLNKEHENANVQVFKFINSTIDYPLLRVIAEQVTKI